MVDGAEGTDGAEGAEGAEGVRFLRREADRAIFAVESGVYRFESNW